MPVILVIGTLLGFLTGLGVGGGSLLIIWLTVVASVSPETARGMNLLFFIPGALIACIFRKKQGDFLFRPIIPAAIAGCIAAAVFSYVSTIIDTQILRKLFGFILLAAGTRELFWKSK